MFICSTHLGQNTARLDSQLPQLVNHRLILFNVLGQRVPASLIGALLMHHAEQRQQ
ncbi:hypothetical protein [Pantoea agglomerans]|uniref:hypothetical protein n=1 Tax=Enterobacter agglomerans TaxID=549 RepID=UPI003DA1A7DF